MYAACSRCLANSMLTALQWTIPTLAVMVLITINVLYEVLFGICLRSFFLKARIFKGTSCFFRKITNFFIRRNSHCWRFGLKWWWIVSDNCQLKKDVKPYFHLEPLSEGITTANFWHTTVTLMMTYINDDETNVDDIY